MESFKTTTSRNSLQTILVQFCLTHKVHYKQGMNEVAAPFLYLLSPDSYSGSPQTLGNAFAFVLFESFVNRYLQHFFCQESSSSMYLFKAFRLFQLLLFHFDPQLGLHLYQNNFIPELYAPQWFLCAYARGLALPLVLRLWDMLLSVDDPAFTFFIGLSLLISKRDMLLLADDHSLPEVIGDMKMEGSDSSIDCLVVQALRLYQRAPRGFLRYLRICCVDTPELAPAPTGQRFVVEDSRLHPELTAPLGARDPSELLGSTKAARTHRSFDNALDLPHEEAHPWDPYYIAMARQSVRRCVLLQASEVVSSLCPIAAPPSRGEGDGDKDRLVLIDIRGSEEVLASGGGDIPTSVRLEPSFLEGLEEKGGGDLLAKWLDHFDSMRGLRLCIVDMPPAHASGGALWRRLLLGQGDGLAPNVVSYGSSPLSLSQTLSAAAALGGSSFYNASIMRSHCDDKDGVIHRDEELAAAKEDQSRVAVHLAALLQQGGFPFISVLDGGFPALVQYLRDTRGALEPLIINHDVDRFEAFLEHSGRRGLGPDLRLGRKLDRGKQAEKESSRGDTTGKAEDLDEGSRLRLAIGVASRLGHPRMLTALKNRLSQLNESV